MFKETLATRLVAFTAYSPSESQQRELSRKRAILRWLAPVQLAKLAKRLWLLLTVLILPFVYFLAAIVQAQLDQSFAVPPGTKDMTTVDQFVIGMSCLLASAGSPATLTKFGIAFGASAFVVLVVGMMFDFWGRFPERLQTPLSHIFANLRDRLLLRMTSSSILTLAVFLAFGIALIPFAGTMALLGQFLEESGRYAARLAEERQAMAGRCAAQTAYVSDLPCTEIEPRAGAKVAGLLVSTANGSFYLADGKRTAVIASSEVVSIRSVMGTRTPPEKLARATSADRPGSD